MDFDKAFNEASNFKFDRFKFDEPTFEMLIFDEDSYLEHLKVQSAGLAYYGTLSKEADRNLEDAERKFKVRYNEMYAECSDTLFRVGRKQVKDVEAMVQTKYEAELKQWEDKIAELKKQKDGINTFYDAWKAKGFSLNAMTSMITAGLLTPKTTITEDDVQSKRDIRMTVQNARRVLSGK